MNTTTLKNGYYYIMASVSDGVNPTLNVFSSVFRVKHYRIEEVTPLVISTTPKNNERDVAVETPIRILFNKDMDPATMTNSNITVECNGAVQQGNIRYDAKNKTTFLTFPYNMRFNSQYNITIKTFVRDIYKNFLGSKYTFTFLTERNTRSPKIVAYFPLQDDRNVSFDTTLWVRYDSEISATTVLAQTFMVKVKDSPDGVIGSLKYNSPDYTVVFTPTNRLLPDTTYQVTVKGMIGANGITAEGKYWTFSTKALDPEQDYDGDSVLNKDDRFPTDPTESKDMDNDGIGDNSDPDIDGDGWNNTVEMQVGTDPRNPGSEPADVDMDWIPDVLENKTKVNGTSDDDSLFFGKNAAYFWILVILLLAVIVIIIIVLVVRRRTAEDEEERHRARAKDGRRRRDGRKGRDGRGDGRRRAGGRSSSEDDEWLGGSEDDEDEDGEDERPSRSSRGRRYEDEFAEDDERPKRRSRDRKSDEEYQDEDRHLSRDGRRRFRDEEDTEYEGGEKGFDNDSYDEAFPEDQEEAPSFDRRKDSRRARDEEEPFDEEPKERSSQRSRKGRRYDDEEDEAEQLPSEEPMEEDWPEGPEDEADPLDDEEDEPDTYVKPKKKPSKSSVNWEDPDEEDHNEDRDDEDDAQEETPRPKKGKRGRSDEEDDWEAPATPARSSKGTGKKKKKYDDDDF
jgi:heme exporter protein D